MNKARKLILIIGALFLLVGCQEIDLNPPIKAPEIELTNEGELLQLYEETEELADITFTLVLKNFADNELSLEDLTITWYEGTTIKAENTLTHFIEVKHTLNMSIKVVVQFSLNNKDQELIEEAVINITERPTQIMLENNIDLNSHQINSLIGIDSGIVTYKATLTNNLTHKTAKWIIVKRDENMDELDRIELEVDLIEEMEIVNNEGVLTLEINFGEAGHGNYLTYLEVGKYISNYQHFILNYGELVIMPTGETTQIDSFTSRSLSVGPISEQLGTGVFKWFKDGTYLEDLDNQLSYTFDSEEIGGSLYHVEFYPEQSHLPVQVSEPVLITNAVEVGTLEELKLALENEVKAVILTADIKLLETLKINYEFTLIGNNFKLYSDGIEKLVHVDRTDNVYIKDLGMEYSNRYHLHYHLSKNGYVENVRFFKPGMHGGMMDLSAGLYVHSSEVTIKNITIEEAPNTGVRIDSPTKDLIREPSQLTILGEFDSGDTLLPVASGNSLMADVKVTAIGYVSFIIPTGMLDGGDSAVIRWSTESEAISWSLNTPNKTDYFEEEEFDFYGITIDVKLPGMDDFEGDLDIVYLFLDMFKQHGTMEIMNLDKEVLQTYYIVGHNNSNKYDDLGYDFGDDLLLFSNEPEGGEHVRPILDIAPGDYLIRVTIGGLMDLGSFKIKVKDVQSAE